jgi:hypothetical protein
LDAKRTRVDDWEFAYDYREQHYTVIPEALMKTTIQQWITQAVKEDTKNMTLVFVAHGYPADESIPAGTIALRWRRMSTPVAVEEDTRSCQIVSG